MSRLVSQRSRKAGLPPGTMVHIGRIKPARTRITVIDYDSQRFEEREVEGVEEVFPYVETPTVTWINIDGIHDVELIGKVGSHFQIHPLAMEDIVNTDQRPKLEDFNHHLYIVLKMLTYDEKSRKVEIEQVSLILGRNYVISFQEKEGDVFNNIRARLRNPQGRARTKGADYLVYSILDSIIDNYFVILEKLGERVEEVEAELTADPSVKTLDAIRRLKREAIYLRKSVWPLRTVINNLERGENPLIDPSTLIYLRDVYDHTIHVIDTIETLRDILSGLLEIYLSSISNKMNEIMKVLTVIATIFIPLTFIAGVYGMNFRHMPELEQRWGYPLVLGIMALVTLSMLYFFRRKKWL